MELYSHQSFLEIKGNLLMLDFILTINKYSIVLSYFFMNVYINLVSVLKTLEESG